MELDQLRTLPTPDQQVFLLGRIAMETTSMDAALRLVHAALRGQHNIDAFLDAPDYVSTTVKQCKILVRDHETLTPQAREAVLAAVDAAGKAYTRRNRFTHDLLRSDLLDRSWELARLTRQPEESADFEPTSFQDMVNLVTSLVALKFRLRGCALFVLNGSWAGMALGEVEGHWDGSATSTR